MWNQKRSLMLSKAFTLLFMGALVALVIGAPWLVKWLIWYSLNARQESYPLFLATIYTGCVLVGMLLYSLYSLLNNIGRDVVFSAANVAHLRRISWCCFLGAGVALASALYYAPWLIVTIAAAFMGLIVRVVKNIVAQAVIIKEENDFTI